MLCIRASQGVQAKAEECASRITPYKRPQSDDPHPITTVQLTAITDAVKDSATLQALAAPLRLA